MMNGKKVKNEPDCAEATQIVVSPASGKTKLFYQNGNISTRVSEQGSHWICWAQEIPMAEVQITEVINILSTDKNSSVLGTPASRNIYSPYGYLERTLNTPLLAFNGQWLDTVTKGYPLGNGYRLYSPELLRFHSPDNLSPFGRSGINSYIYCEADPINNTDPTGHLTLSSVRKGVKNLLGRKARKLERIDNRNKEVQEHNRMNNLFKKRPNKNPDNSVNFENLLENYEGYEAYPNKDFIESLNDKDINYAKKHNLLISTTEPGHRGETFKLANEHYKRLSDFERRAQKKRDRETKKIMPGNPINTKRNFFSPTRIREEQ